MAGRITSLLHPQRIALNVQSAKRTAALNDATALPSHHAARPSGDLRHMVGPERVQQRIQHAGDRGQAGQSGDQEGAATSEVERYCGWPGQACAYKVGHNEWVRLREKAKTALGTRFDIKGFHRVVLTAGQVPLPVLRELVQAWVAKRQAG